jgi:hypothetical protein
MPSTANLTAPPTPITIFRTDAKPLKFSGWLLGSAHRQDDRSSVVTRVRLFRTEAGTYIWSWDRGYFSSENPDGDDEEGENIERADTEIISADEEIDVRDPDSLGFRTITRVPTREEIIARVWERRPTENAKVTEGSSRVWHAAAKLDPVIAAALYDTVK